MIYVTWPHQALWQSVEWRAVGMTNGMQESLSGEMTPIASNRGHWECTAKFVAWTEAQVLAWDAFIGQMAGGLGVTDVPVWQRFPAPDRNGKRGAWQPTGTIVPGQPYEHWGLDAEPTVICRMVAPLALRATQMRIRYDAPQDNTTGPRPGHRFSIGSRLYRVLRYWEDDTSPQIQFWPPAREAAPIGSKLILDRPVCRMRLADEASGVPDMTPSPADFVTAKFIEAR